LRWPSSSILLVGRGSDASGANPPDGEPAAARQRPHLRLADGEGRPIVVIDAGHGGRDPGATSVSGKCAEKELT
jgi:N-acetylmuramoyl-L-alanine amidase